jgi:putative oxidoreductase
MARTNFEHWRCPQWFRTFTGGWEFIGGALLLVGIFNRRLAIVGAIVVGLAMIGAVYTHVIRVPKLKVLPAPIVQLGLAVATALVTAATL